jgi:hypothetical protein
MRRYGMMHMSKEGELGIVVVKLAKVHQPHARLRTGVHPDRSANSSSTLIWFLMPHTDGGFCKLRAVATLFVHPHDCLRRQ